MKRGDIVKVGFPDKYDHKTGWTYLTREAKILTVSDGYAMLRYPRAMPFVKSLKELQKWNNPTT